MHKSLIMNGLRLGAALSVSTTTVILAAAAIETDGAWSGVNNICHIVDGDGKNYSDHFTIRDSLIGLSTNSAAMVTWAILYLLLFGRLRRSSSAAAAALFTAGAYLVDYKIVPARFSPGIEHKISKKAIFWTYVAFFLTLILSPRLTKADG